MAVYFLVLLLLAPVQGMIFAVTHQFFRGHTVPHSLRERYDFVELHMLHPVDWVFQTMVGTLLVLLEMVHWVLFDTPPLQYFLILVGISVLDGIRVWLMEWFRKSREPL